MAKLGPDGIYPESRAGKIAIVVFIVAVIGTLVIVAVTHL